MSYLSRRIDRELEAWRVDGDRKPLLLRGARQVGKTSAVRNLGRRFANYVEVDFNERPDVCEIFERIVSPRQVCEQLSLVMGVPIEDGETLLFLDEIQACPAAINKLRYFYEQKPGLHVIAAGSLLEFALRDLPSFGVGRVRSLFMYSFSFDEFLRALGETALADAITAATPSAPLFEPVHLKALNYLRTFMVTGGMPEVETTYIKRAATC